MLAACGSKSNGPTQPTPPTSSAPQIACPADVFLSGVTGAMQGVTFAAATVTGGDAPVTTVCTPASGSSFPLGTTVVNCGATDAQARQVSCAFTVTLKGFSIPLSRIDAFGDSLTEGEVGRPSLTFSFLDPPNSYPVRLQAAFDDTFPGQNIVVINRGLSGDQVEDTLAKIRQFVPVDRPDAVLLLSGYNNLTKGCGPGDAGTRACGDRITQVQLGIRDCLRRIKEIDPNVKYTFVSNLTPPGPSGSNRIDINAILEANARITQLVASEGAVLVDSYSAFLGHEADYVNVDGLHLRPAGYQALADTFFAAIKATVPQTPLTSTLR